VQFAWFIRRYDTSTDLLFRHHAVNRAGNETGSTHNGEHDS
jgi:hypothetical protein